MADLDTKALEAACLAFNGAPGFTWERVEAAVRAYLSALPNSDEVAGMVKRLREGFYDYEYVEGVAVAISSRPPTQEECNEAATLLEALDAELRTLKDML